jgi:hypothetical protein
MVKVQRRTLPGRAVHWALNTISAYHASDTRILQIYLNDLILQEPENGE